jgi:ATP-dependent Lon protease
VGRTVALYAEGLVGNILPIEAVIFPGAGKEIATGNIAPLLKETISTSISFLKKHHEEFGISPNVFKENDLHVHFHKTEILKRGEGWGLAVFAAILSAVLECKIPADLAFAGQISLLGKVLPTSDMNLKLLSASQLGISKVILSGWNLTEQKITIPSTITAIPIHNLSELKAILLSLNSMK